MHVTASERIPASPGEVAAGASGGMSLPLESRLADSLGGALGMDHATDEMTLARTDRKTLAAILMRSFTDKSTGESLLASSDVYRVVPRRTWVRRKAENPAGNATWP